MGLDMYLNLHIPKLLPPHDNEDRIAYTGFSDVESLNNSEFHQIVEDHNLGDLVCKDSPILLVNNDGTVDLTVAYWRKANAIHKWFVDNCQNGIDECQTSDPIHIEQLAHLAYLCRLVTDDPTLAMDKLPPQAGFFFGSVEIDEWYLGDLIYTSNVLESLIRICIDRFRNTHVEFRYESSW